VVRAAHPSRIRDLKMSDKEGHAQHQRDAYDDDEDKKSAHPYFLPCVETPIRIVGRTFFCSDFRCA
jgi:hypothetical protein